MVRFRRRKLTFAEQQAERAKILRKLREQRIRAENVAKLSKIKQREIARIRAAEKTIGRSKGPGFLDKLESAQRTIGKFDRKLKKAQRTVGGKKRKKKRRSQGFFDFDI